MLHFDVFNEFTVSACDSFVSQLQKGNDICFNNIKQLNHLSTLKFSSGLQICTHTGMTTAAAIFFQQPLPLFYHRQINRAFENFQSYYYIQQQQKSIITYCHKNSTICCLCAVFEECIAFQLYFSVFIVWVIHLVCERERSKRKGLEVSQSRNRKRTTC